MLFVDIYANEGGSGTDGWTGEVTWWMLLQYITATRQRAPDSRGENDSFQEMEAWDSMTLKHTQTWASGSVPRQTTCCQSVCTWSYVSCSSWVQNPPWPAERSAERSRTGWWRRRSPTSPAAPEQRRSATNREEEQHDFSGLHSVSTVNNLVSLCWIFSCLDPINFKPNRINSFFCFCSIIWTFYY